MHAIVTGTAGFIGSHVAERLLEHGSHVRGIDCFTPYYDTAIKHRNVAALRRWDRFELVAADLRTAPLDDLLAGADVVYHLAAQAGVRGSWADGFQEYAEHNVIATQRLLEAARRASVRRVVYASSSSVYGNAGRYPTTEDDAPSPFSPYGVTKMAAEQLCCAYAENFGLSTASLRYFTVYGERQRPEMAVSRLIDAALTGRTFPLFGDGNAVRDFTYVGDIARATVDAGTADLPSGVVMNVGGGDPVTMNELITVVADAVGRSVPVERRATSPGDVRRTGGVTDLAARFLGWRPEISLAEGVRRQSSWQAEQLVAAA
jgi:UDP-glucuronate 4-epimerase